MGQVGHVLSAPMVAPDLAHFDPTSFLIILLPPCFVLLRDRLDRHARFGLDRARDGRGRDIGDMEGLPRYRRIVRRLSTEHRA